MMRHVLLFSRGADVPKSEAFLVTVRSFKHVLHVTILGACEWWHKSHGLMLIHEKWHLNMGPLKEIPSDEQTSFVGFMGPLEVFHFQCWKESDVNPHYLLKMYHLLKMYLLLTYGTSWDFSCHVTREYIYWRLESTIAASAIRTFALTLPVIASGRDATDCSVSLMFPKESGQKQWISWISILYKYIPVLCHMVKGKGQIYNSRMKWLFNIFQCKFRFKTWGWAQQARNSPFPAVNTFMCYGWVISLLSLPEDNSQSFNFEMTCYCQQNEWYSDTHSFWVCDSVIDQVGIGKSMECLRLDPSQKWQHMASRCERRPCKCSTYPRWIS